jgi:hypothetical protein
VDAKKSVGGEKTNFEGKSKKGFLAITLVTVLSILAVIAVYSAFIASFTGEQVTVQGPSFSTSIVTYSSDNATWTQTLSVTAPGAWYSRLQVLPGYSGPVTITWQLQNETAPSTFTNVAGAYVQTNMMLNGSSEDVYASSDGTNNNNYNWGSLTTNGGAYEVYVSVSSA